MYIIATRGRHKWRQSSHESSEEALLHSPVIFVFQIFLFLHRVLTLNYIQLRPKGQMIDTRRVVCFGGLKLKVILSSLKMIFSVSFCNGPIRTIFCPEQRSHCQSSKQCHLPTSMCTCNVCTHVHICVVCFLIKYIIISTFAHLSISCATRIKASFFRMLSQYKSGREMEGETRSRFPEPYLKLNKVPFLRLDSILNTVCRDDNQPMS